MRKLFFPLVIAVMLLAGVGCLDRQAGVAPVALTYWRADGEASDLQEVISAYQEKHPHVSVTVRILNQDSYRRELLEALAEGRGPDIFSLPQAWLREWSGKIRPLPKQRTVYELAVGADGADSWSRVTKNSLSLIALERDFAAVAAEAVVLPDHRQADVRNPDRAVYGLPLSADTLALYYNRDLLRNANITAPPQSWNQLQDQARSLTRRGADGSLEQAGAAIGWSNVSYSPELLMAIVFQNGASLGTESGMGFWLVPSGWSRGNTPAIEAWLYYIGLSDPKSSGAVWDRSLPNDLDAFIAGRVAFYFGLPDDARKIRARAPRLDLGVAPLPQVDAGRRVNIPLFPVETVSKDSPNPGYAWDFLEFAASAGPVASYLEAAARPAALRVLLDGQRERADVGPFAEQVLTARNWYFGYDYLKVRSLLNGFLGTEPTRDNPYQKIMNSVGEGANATYRRPSL